MCGASTLPLPIPINNIFIGAQMLMPAVQGGLDSHSLLGALIAQSGSMVNLGPMQLPAIAAIKDMASPDILGLIPHVTGLPIPVQGENTVRIGSGSAAAGIGMMQQLGLGNFGALSIGELVSVAGTVMGMVQNFTGIGGGAAVAQLSNLQGAPISPGTTVVGQTSGYSFTFANYFDTRVMTGDYAYPAIESISDALVQDDGQYIVIQDYIDFYPTMNLTASVLTQ
jgi:hypothetical protein